MMKVTQKPTVLMERFPYRYVQVGKLEINGMPDCRIQKVDSYTGRYRDMYLCDNEMQLMTAMEDHDYLLVGLVGWILIMSLHMSRMMKTRRVSKPALVGMVN
jgi:hypothetical protein